jgi:hypothetical protein
MLPMGLGYVEGVTHDYVRHGTTTLFAALDIANGQVLTQARPPHRHQEFLGFLRRIDQNVPEELEVLQGAGAQPSRIGGQVCVHPDGHYRRGSNLFDLKHRSLLE